MITDGSVWWAIVVASSQLVVVRVCHCHTVWFKETR